MTDIPPSSEQVSLQDQLLASLRALGGYAGNVSLQRRLAWDDDKYWRVRDSLVDSGRLRRGRGRGGSIQLVEAIVTTPSAPPVSPAPQTTTTEDQLYDPVSQVLRTDWARDNRFRQCLVEITARQGRRLTGGTWTRPDIVVATLRVFPYVIGRHFDVITFEVKPAWAVDITAVYEALAHRRAATQAYVWLHLPDSARDGLDQTIEAICTESKRLGVGVIAASQPASYDTWDTLVEAERAVPDPEALNDFINLQLSADAKQDIIAWIR